MRPPIRAVVDCKISTGDLHFSLNHVYLARTLTQFTQLCVLRYRTDTQTRSSAKGATRTLAFALERVCVSVLYLNTHS